MAYVYENVRKMESIDQNNWNNVPNFSNKIQQTVFIVTSSFKWTIFIKNMMWQHKNNSSKLNYAWKASPKILRSYILSRKYRLDYDTNCKILIKSSQEWVQNENRNGA